MKSDDPPASSIILSSSLGSWAFILAWRVSLNSSTKRFPTGTVVLHWCEPEISTVETGHVIESAMAVNCVPALKPDVSIYRQKRGTWKRTWAAEGLRKLASICTSY